ncbi:hypothetical protein [Hydrogenophaga sp. BPS33]|uniref:hypothetical protein n=1 Tax=Hydrogenophaga sp. BPS33 TaxID=2651974 RepID=UPI00131FE266|nr:hypothetical protein [Hydrogenophaga sp. BPS33]QHE87756.1 hypothetical protein F9K07_24100 [Hydrogenophaga sp. BPS33]
MPNDLSPTPNRLTRAGYCGFAAVLAFWLGACSTAPAAPESAQPRGDTPATVQPPPAPATPPTKPTVTPLQASPAAPPVVLNAETPSAPDLVSALLSYADRLQALSPSDLAAEIVVQGDPGTVPLRQMQLALALTHLRQPAETARALGLLQRVIGHTGPESLPLKPLARVLANRLMDQRKLEENVDRQAQQLRESQRRIDQLNERLEAMRAIERSLTTRPPATPRPNAP